MLYLVPKRQLTSTVYATYDPHYTLGHVMLLLSGADFRRYVVHTLGRKSSRKSPCDLQPKTIQVLTTRKKMHFNDLYVSKELHFPQKAQKDP